MLLSSSRPVLGLRKCSAAISSVRPVLPVGRRALRLVAQATQEGPAPEQPQGIPIIREEVPGAQSIMRAAREGRLDDDEEPNLSPSSLAMVREEDELSDGSKTAVEKFLYPDPEEMPQDMTMPIWDHLEEFRERVFVAGIAAALAIVFCFVFSKELIVFLEAPVADAGVRFLQLSPGEFFFTTFKASGYAGLLLAAPTVLYEITAYVVPGLTKSERAFLAPVVFGSSTLLLFSYEVLTPAALNFFVSYADGAVESLWSIDQYFEFVLVLMLSTGLSFQVPVLQVMLGQLGIVTSEQMFSIWRYVVVGSTVAAAVLTPSTDPFTQALLAIPLVGLYMGGASVVRLIEQGRGQTVANSA
ncbi:hypothetical protein CHLRE_03g145887v5 [Chlamydomonas reinhardtii]|uniref:Sec-independent protein translocase protein TatC n=1 Tax=Chlamydomonas reinhardtii TaxID=3055 RepID=A0A2K3DVD4_CHLRE|nr:uncharacterized protein CHLRE_03g145887v5 [Chlamydomonas reinhardtii]PNW84489.1 hypothetical protein CHLRE_03g145887v5 [Chlamydomonas reinhardtii]